MFYLFKIYNIILSTRNIISHSTKKIMFFKFKSTDQNHNKTPMNFEFNCIDILYLISYIIA